MQIEKVVKNGVNIAVINSPEQLISDSTILSASVLYLADIIKSSADWLSEI